MGIGSLAYRLYQRRLLAAIPPDRVPRHIAVMIDGNRRWARALGNHVSSGHQAGAEKIPEFLGWCEELGVDVVTIYMLSTDNLSRPADELEPLLDIIERIVDQLAATRRWRLHPVGALTSCPHVSPVG